MSNNQQTLWDGFLKPIITSLIDQKKLQELYNSIDWEKESDRLSNPQLIYPEYYLNSKFHGIEKGYLTPSAAVSYDPITQYVLPPNETWVRQGLIDTIGGQPRRILDLGCGTGSTTIMLKQKFPKSQVIGLDLSPYMLVMAEYKAGQARLEIEWRHGLAEATKLANESIDLVTASLLFHETPPNITKLICQEAFRLLTPGGQMLILDGNQKSLRQAEWLTQVFEEPYIKVYAANSLEASLGYAGFERVETQDWWWFHQITKGRKPSPIEDIYPESDIYLETPSPAF